MIFNSFIVIMCPSIVLHVGVDDDLHCQSVVLRCTSTSNHMSFIILPHPIICHSMFPHIQSSVFHVYFTSVSVFFNVPSHLSVSFAIHNSRVFLCSLCVHQLGAHATSEVSSELLTFIKLSIKYGCHSCNLNTNYHNIVSHCPPN